MRLQVDGDKVAVAGKPDAEAPQTRRQSLEGVHLVRVEDAQLADRQSVQAGAGGQQADQIGFADVNAVQAQRLQFEGQRGGLVGAVYAGRAREWERWGDEMVRKEEN